MTELANSPTARTPATVVRTVIVRPFMITSRGSVVRSRCLRAVSGQKRRGKLKASEELNQARHITDVLCHLNKAHPDDDIAGAVWLKPSDSPGAPGVAAAYGLLNGYAIDPQEPPV